MTTRTTSPGASSVADVLDGPTQLGGPEWRWRFTRILLLTCLSFRVLSPTVLNLPLLLTPGVHRPSVVAVLLLWAVANLAVVVVVTRLRETLPPPSALLVVLDMIAAISVCVTLTVLASAAEPGLPAGHLTEIKGWSAVPATVALWMWCRGGRAGFALILLTTPVPVWMLHTEGAGWLSAMVFALPYLGQLVIAALVVMGVKALFRLCINGSRAQGIHDGRIRERTRSLRLMHDRAVQSLEGIALLATSCPPQDSYQVLSRIGRVAHDEAGGLRRRLLADDHRTSPGRPDEAPGDQWAPVREVVRSATAHGLQVRLLVGQSAQQAPAGSAQHHESASQVHVIADIVREALANVRKHAGTERAIVHLSASPQTLRVRVEDAGRGFDPVDTPMRFGIPHSIKARAVDAGGGAELDAAAGCGVRVRAWVPRAEPAETSIDISERSTTTHPPELLR
ncbi:MAG: sensor histidine kinase [Angustibacter sp.]